MNLLSIVFLVFSLQVSADNSVEDRASVPEVMMNHYLVGANSEFPALQTYGVATCVGVILYDPYAQVGAIMHVSASTNIVHALGIVLNELEQKAGGPLKLKATLLGGWDNSMGEDTGMTYESGRMVRELVVELRKENILIVENRTLVTKKQVDDGYPAILNMEVDLVTGQISSFEQTVPYEGGDISLPMPELSSF